jgi:hypothetical protein
MNGFFRIPNVVIGKDDEGRDAREPLSIAPISLFENETMFVPDGDYALFRRSHST